MAKYPMQLKKSPFELKAVDFEGSTFEGYSAGIGNEDHGRDIILPGAFKRTIRERVGSRAVKLLDNHTSWGNVTKNLLGMVTDAKEEPVEGTPEIEGLTHRLWSAFRASMKQVAQEALRDIKDGILDGLSIGYRPIKVEFEVDAEDDDIQPEIAWLVGRGVRRIKELAWWETSLVLWGMNPAALVIPDTVKSLAERAASVAKGDGDVDPRDLLYAIRDLKNLVRDSEELPAILRNPEIEPTILKVEALVDEAQKHTLPANHSTLAAQLFEHWKAQVKEAENGVEFAVWVDTLIQEGGGDEVDQKDELLQGVLDRIDINMTAIRKALEDPAVAEAEGEVGEKETESDSLDADGEALGDAPAAAAAADATGTEDSEAAGGEVPAEATDDDLGKSGDDPASVEGDSAVSDSDKHFLDEEELAAQAAFLETLKLKVGV